MQTHCMRISIPRTSSYLSMSLGPPAPEKQRVAQVAPTCTWRAHARAAELILATLSQARSKTSCPNTARPVLRADVRGIPAADHLKPLECLHLGLQGTGPDSSI